VTVGTAAARDGLLSVERLTIVARPSTTLVDGVSFHVNRGEVFGICGESGSGKTMSVLALVGLNPPTTTASGHAGFGSIDLLSASPKEMRHIRGRRIGFVFQDPLTSLHPMFTVGQLLTEHVRWHLHLSAQAANAKALELLEIVRIPGGRTALNTYPHQFSGGMRQRIAIAVALACGPELLIADEPTTSLDVTVQAGILRLLDELRREAKLSVVLISHNLAVMAALADRLAVFYSGRIVEAGPTADVLSHPRHPYTAGLLAALPARSRQFNALSPISGMAPSPTARPSGCAFHPRCSFALPECRAQIPELGLVGRDRFLACPPDPLAASA